mmetsp:Transcript_28327/g.67365  ORF Transcript_28327/g.67365 Transcript_28327/m.67365 type:complete len:148 (+) Transcript_28327:844-1287(+)
MCCQLRALADLREGLCEKCLLGRRFPLRYECERCGRLQCIPHPMWQYQDSPGSFSGTTWACHQMCGDYTRWRVTPADAEHIPPELCPGSWGRHSEWLATVREQSRQGPRSVLPRREAASDSSWWAAAAKGLQICVVALIVASLLGRG